ncbi:MFS transporter [Occallatibacter riparius]|uniref:MFS transporter n=1 Tax=Occallatibacter riparius TaxID=1002689 RepID=A0A9J7BNX0_9BACT|nr:MFS transporter [Occallatibacter riparius]UWZ84217.1 MFS transporter [Occallatibacter riparius]
MKRNRWMAALVFLVFFVLSLLTNILGPIIPDIIDSFHVSLTAAAFLPFAFFLAYGVLSIPAGFLVEKLGDKPVMVLSFAAAMAGALAFATEPVYWVALVSLFTIGAGMAMLQVVINPLLRIAGGEEHFAFNSAFAQFVFGAASFISPHIYSYMVNNLPNAQARGGLLQVVERVTPAELPWASIYWIFAAVSAAMLVTVALVRFPQIVRKEDEQAGSVSTYAQLMKRKVVWLYFGCVFAYVGSEQGTANWISRFLSQYHGFDPHTTGADAVSWFWGLMTAGCFLGMILLKWFDSRRVLLGFSACALVGLSVALFGPAGVSLYAFPAIGFFASIMWPTVMSLALNSVAEHHGTFAGILCTGIVGGAVVPLIIGRIGDVAGLRTGMVFLYVTFGCVLSVGLWARPIISNATLGTKAENTLAT